MTQEPGSTASGEKSLKILLASLTVSLHPSTFAFLTFPTHSPPSPKLKDSARMIFKEDEGTTVVTTVEAAEAENTMDHSFPCKMITCNVHSSLDAVGFMAVIAERLAAVGMGANPVSGYFHDHIFVPTGKEAQAMKELAALALEARQQ